MLDYSKPKGEFDVLMFTGNPIIKRNGELVMGAGAAKQVRDTYNGIAGMFGFIRSTISSNNVAFIDYLISKDSSVTIGWFKVKDHWRQNAKLNIIERSVRELSKIAVENTDWTFHLNAPGIGNGQLTWEEVEPLVKQLPDNVIIYKS